MVQDRWSMICLCSHLKPEKGLRPLTTAEFRDLSNLLRRYGKTTGDLFQMNYSELISIGISKEPADRLFTLLDRVFVLESLLDSYENMGIRVITAVDPAYFPMLKATLGANCPPVLCCAGNLALADKPVIGVVGARDISPVDAEFAVDAVNNVLRKDYGILSGGARGTDSVAESECLRQGGSVVEFPAYPLLQRLRKPEISHHLQEGRLLLASPAAPHTGFSSNLAATRNRMIYAHSTATIVIRATHRRGGTWSGAADALKRNLCPILCRDYPYEGNKGLIQAGAIPIDENFVGEMSAAIEKSIPVRNPANEIPEQFSLF